MINIKVSGVTSNASSPVTYFLTSGVPNFPLYTMGKNSYIDSYGGYIRTSIEQDLNAGKSYVHNIQIGNYCSIATEVNFCVGSNHDYRALSTSGAASVPKYEYNFTNKGQIIIQNDVWIGHGATIMAGVTVHNGAVIAANSHVVKDVPPYAIVGGNPARIIKYRFSESLIKKLQLIRWWDWADEKIEANKEFLNTYDVESFCKKFYPAALAEKQAVPAPYYSKVLGGKEIYLYFLDLKAPFSLWQRVIKVFKDLHILKMGGGEEDILLLILDKNETQHSEMLIQFLNETIPVDKRNSVFIQLQAETERSLISKADFFIANRDPRTVMRSEFAD